MTGFPAPDPGIPLPVLLSQAGERARDLLQQRFASSRLRPRHANVLLFLERTGSAGQQALLEWLEVDPSVLVGLLNDLEGDGMVERRRDPADRRRHIVTLSAEGKAVVEDVHTSIAQVGETLFAAMSDADCAQLRRILTVLLAGNQHADPSCTAPA